MQTIQSSRILQYCKDEEGFRVGTSKLFIFNNLLSAETIFFTFLKKDHTADVWTISALKLSPQRSCGVYILTAHCPPFIAQE